MNPTDSVETYFAPNASYEERLDLLGHVLNELTHIETLLENNQSHYEVAEIQLWVPTIQSKYWTPAWNLRVWKIPFRTYLNTDRDYPDRGYSIGFRVEEKH